MKLLSTFIVLLLMASFFSIAEEKQGEAIRVEVGVNSIHHFIQPWANVTNIGSEPIEDMQWYVTIYSFLPHYVGTCYGSLSLQQGEEKMIRCPSFFTLFGPFKVQFVVNYGYEKCPVIKTLKFFILPPLMFGGEIEYPEMCFDGELLKENGTERAFIIVTYVEGEVYYNADSTTPNIVFIDAFTGKEYYVGKNLHLVEEKSNLYTGQIKIGDRIELVQVYPPLIVKWLPTGAVITKIEWFW